MLEKEFKFFRDHQDDLLKKYRNRYITIVGNEVVGDYDNCEDAFYKSKMTHKMGTFLIQHCVEGENAYTYTFHNVNLI